MKITNKKLLHALGKDDSDEDLQMGVSQVASDTTISGVQWVTGPDPSAPPTAIVHRITPEPTPVTATRPKAPRPVMEDVAYPEETETAPHNSLIDTLPVDSEPVPTPTPLPPPLAPPLAPPPPPITPQVDIPPTPPTRVEEMPHEDIDTAQRVRDMFKNLSESKRTYKDREKPPATREEPPRRAWMPTHDTAPKVASQEPPDIWDTPSSVGTAQTPDTHPAPLSPPQSEPSLDTMLVDELLTDKGDAVKEVPDVWDAIESDKARTSRIAQPLLDTEEKQRNMQLSEPKTGTATADVPEMRTPEEESETEPPVAPAIKMDSQQFTAIHNTHTPPLDTHFKEAIRTDAHTKARAVFELMEGKPVAEVAKTYGVTTTHLWLWKRIAEEELHKVFKTNPAQEPRDARAEIDALKQKIDSLHTLLGERDDEIASLKDTRHP